jgi:hypothetical protein
MMACSSKKTMTEGKVPALQRYDGPLWQTLRAANPNNNKAFVTFLSAKFGFHDALYTLPIYDMRLTPSSAQQMIQRGIELPWPPPQTKKPGLPGETPRQAVGGECEHGKCAFDHVALCGGELYIKVMHAFVKELQEIGYIRRDARVMVINDSIGKMRQQLRSWLAESPPAALSTVKEFFEGEAFAPREMGCEVCPAVFTAHDGTFCRADGNKARVWCDSCAKAFTDAEARASSTALADGVSASAPKPGEVQKLGHSSKRHKKRAYRAAVVSTSTPVGEERAPYAVELVQVGEKCLQRQRVDKRVASYVQEKRPPANDHPRIYNYRTATCLACNEARAEGVDPDLMRFLEAEHMWAVARLMEFDPKALVSLGYPVYRSNPSQLALQLEAA